MGKDDYKRRANIFQLFFSIRLILLRVDSFVHPTFLANPFTMRFSVSFVALAVTLSGVVASPVDAGQPADIIVEFNLSIGTKYNAPYPPWEKGCHPGWYYGNGEPEVQSNQYPYLTTGGVRTFGLVL